jgi:hypothetical protein
VLTSPLPILDPEEVLNAPCPRSACRSMSVHRGISTDPACIVSVSVSENTNRKVNTKVVSMGVVAFDALKRMAFSRLCIFALCQRLLRLFPISHLPILFPVIPFLSPSSCAHHDLPIALPVR